MSVLGHIAIGVVTARAGTPGLERGAADQRRSGPLAGRMAALAALALGPDVDLLLGAMFPGVSVFEHRGPTHSLFVAALIGVLVAGALTAGGNGRPLRWGLVAGLVVASHGLVDSVGSSDLGVQLFWPFSDERFLAPWRFLPDPSLGRPFVTQFLWPLAAEAVLYLPAWVYAFAPRSVLGAHVRRRPQP